MTGRLGHSSEVASGLDRRALGVLGSGHLCVDLCQGAVPALLPFLAAQRGYSYAALGALVLASTIGSSILDRSSERERTRTTGARSRV